MIYHKKLESGKWFELSFLQQMGNVGSEIYRAIKWFRLKDDRFQTAFDMALELFDLTIKDNRWYNERTIVMNYRKLFIDTLTNYDTVQNAESKLDEINEKFYEYGLAANEERYKLRKNIS
jgi:hypothetical protein